MTLIKPVITEKSMRSAMLGLYTFEVMVNDTKSLIKAEVNSTFKVNVTDISILRRHIPGKGTGSKRLMGKSSQSKYAVVKLKKGQTIDLFDIKEEK